MIAQCWLHIGTEKTGTTSIQDFLAHNRKALVRSGVLYPAAPGRSNHVGLACFALDDDRDESIRRSLDIHGPVAAAHYRSRLTAEIKNEVDSSSASSIVFSNEHLSARLQTASEIQRIKDLCDRFAANTKIIVYLRSQVDFLVSRYIEAVKGGSTKPFSFTPLSALAEHIKYDRMLAPWRDIFGFDNMIVVRFEPQDFEGGDLLLDFASRCGVNGASLDRIPRRNMALDGPCVEFLRQLNSYVPHIADGRRNPLRGRIVQDLECLRFDRPFAIPRAIASAIEDHYHASNKALSREYFGSRYEPLFGPSDKADEALPANAPAITAADGVRIAGHLWQSQQTRLNASASRTGSSSNSSTSTEHDP